MNSIASGKVADAREDAIRAERIRQRGLDQEASALNTESQDQFADFQPKQEEKKQTLSDLFTGQQTDVGGIVPQSSSNITVQEEAKQRGQAQDFTNQQGEALAGLRSFGDVLGDLNRGMGRNAAEIGMLGGFKQASQGILPMELQAAQSKGGTFRTLGDILGAAGMATSMYGLGAGSGPIQLTPDAVPAAKVGQVFRTGGGGFPAFGGIY